MNKLAILGVAALGLAACQSTPPTSNGVGFNNGFGGYEIDRARQEAGMTADPYAPNPMNAAPSAPLSAPGAVSTGAINSGDLAAAGIGGAVPAATGNAGAPLQIQSSGISDEQDFNAVSGRESIESDAERRAQAAAAYQVIQPTALPTQEGSGGPNIVQYALSAPNRVGQNWYSRFMFSGRGRFERNCAGYRTPDEAQRDFLARGGPDRDPRGLDPDGDGFACGWDPAPFLAAVGRN